MDKKYYLDEIKIPGIEPSKEWKQAFGMDINRRYV